MLPNHGKIIIRLTRNQSIESWRMFKKIYLNECGEIRYDATNNRIGMQLFFCQKGKRTRACLMPKRNSNVHNNYEILYRSSYNLNYVHSLL